MERVTSLIAGAALKPGCGIMIHKPSNVFYLSGFRGEGLLLISDALRVILTDFRYVEQAQRQAPGWQVRSVTPGVSHIRLAAAVSQEAGINAILYEDDFVTVKDFSAMREAFAASELSSLARLPEALRVIKDEDELALMSRACDISCEAYEYILGEIKPGMSERDIMLKLNFKMLSLGADELAFSTIVASGPNGSLPHATATERLVKPGDMITLDFGARYRGYCADMTRTLALGEPDARLRRIYDIVLDAQKTCQDALGPGRDCRGIDRMARDIIDAAGYGDCFGHGLGHAVGIDIHEEPRLSQTADAKLEPGIVITVEPGIYVPGLGGVRIENTCAITAAGARSLVGASRELVIL